MKKPVRKHGRFRKQHGKHKGEVIMNDLIKIVNTKISDAEIKTVNAREPLGMMKLAQKLEIAV